MPVNAYALDEKLGGRLLDALDVVETTPWGRPEAPGRPRPLGTHYRFLRVVSATIVGPGGVVWYTARVLKFDPAAGSWADVPVGGDVWLVSAHNYGLRPAQRVGAILVAGYTDTGGEPFFVPLLDDQSIPLFDEQGNALVDDVAEQVVGESRLMFATSDKLADLNVRCEGGQIVQTKG